MIDDATLRRERPGLLREYAERTARVRELRAAGDLDGEIAELRRRHAVVQRYVAILPAVAVARCPDSGAVVRYGIDTVDLDGWFWNHDASMRRHDPVPDTWLAMCGAMRLAEPLPHIPFWCSPGPGLPYVIPRLLGLDGVQAVLCEVPIGPHTGWAITYFGPLPRTLMLENLWGMNAYDVYDDTNVWLGVAEYETPFDELDFDLEPWLAAGKLWWIRPGDTEAELHGGIDGCPYLGLTGERGRAYPRFGQIRRLP